MFDKQGVLRAANALINDPFAEKLYATLMAVTKLPKHLPIGIVGDADVMNPLLNMYHSDRDGFDRVMAMVDARRTGAGMPALVPEEVEPGFDKREYQRVFMDQKRQRERRAVEIENLLRPERDKLIGIHRLEFMRHQSARWKTKRDEMVAAVKEVRGVQHLSKPELQAVLTKFWAQVDKELDALEAETVRKMRGG